MRPKASDRNRAIALAFAKMVMMPSDSKYFDPVPCAGPRSVFAVFNTCLPALTRSDAIQNKNGVSIVEMNKVICSNGIERIRKREQIPGTIDKWRRGSQRWRRKRWINPTRQREYAILEKRLQSLHETFPETRCCSLNSLVQTLLAALQPKELYTKEQHDDYDFNDALDFDETEISKRVLPGNPEPLNSTVEDSIGFRTLHHGGLKFSSPSFYGAPYEPCSIPCVGPAQSIGIKIHTSSNKAAINFPALGNAPGIAHAPMDVHVPTTMQLPFDGEQRQLLHRTHVPFDAVPINENLPVDDGHLLSNYQYVPSDGPGNESSDAHVTFQDGDQAPVYVHDPLPQDSSESWMALESLPFGCQWPGSGSMCTSRPSVPPDGPASAYNLPSTLIHATEWPSAAPVQQPCQQADWEPIRWQAADDPQVSESSRPGSCDGWLPVKDWESGGSAAGSSVATAASCPMWARPLLELARQEGWRVEPLAATLWQITSVPALAQAVCTAVAAVGVLALSHSARECGSNSGRREIVGVRYFGSDRRRGSLTSGDLYGSRGDVCNGGVSGGFSGGSAWSRGLAAAVRDAALWDGPAAPGAVPVGGVLWRDEGIVGWVLDPSTFRPTAVACNDAMARMVGVPAADLKAGLAWGNIPAPFGAVEHLCVVLDSLYGIFHSTITQCTRWRWAGQAGTSLVMRRVTRHYDWAGRSYLELHHHRILCPSEFDSYAKSSTDSEAAKAGSGILWQLMAAVGGCRTGEQLLAAAEEDWGQTVVGLSRSAEGREALGRLAEEIERCFAPLATAARRMCEALGPQQQPYLLG